MYHTVTPNPMLDQREGNLRRLEVEETAGDLETKLSSMFFECPFQSFYSRISNIVFLMRQLVVPVCILGMKKILLFKFIFHWVMNMEVWTLILANCFQTYTLLVYVLIFLSLDFK